MLGKSRRAEARAEAVRQDWAREFERQEARHAASHGYWVPPDTICFDRPYQSGLTYRRAEQVDDVLGAAVITHYGDHLYVHPATPADPGAPPPDTATEPPADAGWSRFG